MPLIIDQNWLEENRNERVDDSPWQRTVRLTGGASGSARVISALQKAAKLGTQIPGAFGYVPSPTLQRLDTHTGTALGVLGITRIPSATSEALKSLQGGHAVEIVRDTTDAMAVYANAISFVTGNTPLRTVASAFDFTSDVADAQQSITDMTKASELLDDSRVTGLVKEAIIHSRDYYFWATLKAVGSVATAIFGFMLVAAGAPLSLTIALTTLALATNLIAIRRDIHRDLGQFKVIEFNRDVKLA